MYKKRTSNINKKIFKGLALTRRLLVGLGSVLMDDSYDFDPLWYHSTARRKTLEDKYYANEAKIRTALYNMKRLKFIEERKRGDKAHYVLTEKGRAAALKDRVRIAETLPENYVCMLSFDVPEQERRVRVKMRRLLKDWGFTMDHQSLWTSRKDIFVPFSEYLKDLEVYKWFHLYESRSLR